MALELGCLVHKDVITKDGRKIGALVGANVSTSDWTVPTIVVEVNKDLVEQLDLQKSMLKNPRINITTDLISVVGDVIQLTVEMKGLKEHI